MSSDPLAKLRDRSMRGRRALALYEALDQAVPHWPALVSDPLFEDWATFVDSEAGGSMAERIGILLDDPVFAAEDLAIILRLFDRQNPRQSEKVGGILGRLLPNLRRPLPALVRTCQPLIAKKYEPIRLLGRGGNGEVFLVWSRETSKFYALKSILGELMRDTEARTAFRREAALWIGMGDHPNIAKAFFFEDVGAALYVTMSLAEEDALGVGPALSDKIVAGPIAESILIRWFLQVIAGLEHAYDHGVCAHRDIKPGNILIARDGTAMISDFGLAVPLQGRIQQGDVGDAARGTPLFMPPEQFESAIACDVRSDIYSLGVALYQAVSGGRFPFMPAFTPKRPEDLPRYFGEVRHLHERGAPKRLSSALWPVISRCLEKRPASRYQTLQHFCDALLKVAPDQSHVVSEREESPHDFWTLRDQGNTFFRLGEHERALSYFDAFLEKLSDDSVRMSRALCLQNMGRFDEAVIELEKLAKYNNDSLINLAGCLLKLKRLPEAIDCAERATHASPEEPVAWTVLGNARYAAQDFPGAVDAYARAHAASPDDPTPLYNLGLAASAAKREVTAHRAFREFLQRALPDDARIAYVKKTLGGHL